MSVELDRIDIGGHRTPYRRNAAIALLVALLSPFFWFHPQVMIFFADEGEMTNYLFAGFISGSISFGLLSYAWECTFRKPLHFPFLMTLTPHGPDLPEQGLREWRTFGWVERKPDCLIFHDKVQPEENVWLPLDRSKHHTEAVLKYLREHAPAALMRTFSEQL